jgi:hypothetical protein
MKTMLARRLVTDPSLEPPSIARSRDINPVRRCACADGVSMTTKKVILAARVVRLSHYVFAAGWIVNAKSTPCGGEVRL